ncbi:orotidine 5'-phosphate decarboxylase [Microbacterium sp. zg.Y1090]|uniref:orotidine 5'-phosphate decarboxylase / HUMPS family protein n=1 Tax=Microbacterium TaxID=33882 RepID=UPI00214C2387|nr:MULTISPECIES: orotidine 5'-phosphate decarboxylase / HUMPS family protein [unclassified Microbacterium]MCR2812936.1 orotidine 5'-phosphate decarboxylase [Microbacterium sp. zg.Y1084]MCR2817255.1 orotidine 5'-phosphate decarboxylase [Microbacterium sp. zg.Y1090]MDL5486077.1 orotidine 5'-phosphate decarboxylase / HUMPS family protein [Microbacterium sp. zg-Y1211]WIM29255.1 orotidine 5'-phosphate decarboxylase [Microbacterium sp. zg-Y1090]
MSTTIRGLTRASITRPLVQISLDLTSSRDALQTAAVAVEAGADWIEVGTPLVLAEGLHAVRALRKEFPRHPLIVDLKTMDGGYLEAEMMGDAGADAVIVMGRAHDATIDAVVAAGERFGMLVMGDDLGAPDRVAECARLESLGVGMVIHHIGYDHRNAHPDEGLSPLTDLPAIVAATSVPVQAVGGLSIEQAVGCPALGAPVVVFGAPLAIDGRSFAAADGDLLGVLTEACARVHSAPVRYGPGGA